MDFLAGMMCGGGVAGAIVMMMWSHTVVTMDDMMKDLKNILKDAREEKRYDDSENWKYGGSDGDDD
jgi:hypothetical protein